MAAKALDGFVERYCSLVDTSLWVGPAGKLIRPSLRVMAARTTDLGFELSVPLLNKWRTSASANPGGYYLVALSALFEVPITIWFDEASFTAELRRAMDLEKEHRPTLPSQAGWTTPAA